MTINLMLVPSSKPRLEMSQKRPAVSESVLMSRKKHTFVGFLSTRNDHKNLH